MERRSGRRRPAAWTPIPGRLTAGEHVAGARTHVPAWLVGGYHDEWTPCFLVEFSFSAEPVLFSRGAGHGGITTWPRQRPFVLFLSQTHYLSDRSREAANNGPPATL